MSGWCYNMNSKSLVVIADKLMADEALLLLHQQGQWDHVVFRGYYIVDNELPAL